MADDRRFAPSAEYLRHVASRRGGNREVPAADVDGQAGRHRRPAGQQETLDGWRFTFRRAMPAWMCAASGDRRGGRLHGTVNDQSTCVSTQRRQMAAREPLQTDFAARLSKILPAPSIWLLPAIPPVMDGARGNPRAVRRARQGDALCAESNRRATNLRMSTWMVRRNPILHRPRDWMPTHSGIPRSAGIGTHGPDRHPQPGPTPPQPRFDAGG